MYKGKEVLCIITARGGSKGLPGKNTREIHGKPLIAWTIEAALRAKHPDRVVVSTDAAEIAEVAKQWGAEAPFIRPAELAKDSTPGIEPVLHAIKTLKEAKGYVAHITVLLQPTSPLRGPADIDAAIERVVDEGLDSLVGVCPAAKPPQWAMRLEAGRLRLFMKDTVARRQAAPVLYMPNGAIYAANTEFLLKERTFFPDSGPAAYVMGREASVDIDDEFDFRVAECLLRSRLIECEGDLPRAPITD